MDRRGEQRKPVAEQLYRGRIQRLDSDSSAPFRLPILPPGREGRAGWFHRSIYVVMLRVATLSEFPNYGITAGRYIPGSGFTLVGGIGFASSNLPGFSATIGSDGALYVACGGIQPRPVGMLMVKSPRRHP